MTGEGRDMLKRRCGLAISLALVIGLAIWNRVSAAGLPEVDPDPDDTVIDPACGSGGFLVVALEHIWQKITEEATRRGMSDTWLDEKKKEVANRAIRGIDKDDFLATV